MVTHQGALLLLSGPKQSCCLLRGPPQPPPVSSMLVPQTSPPGGAENRHTMFRTVKTCPLHMYCTIWILKDYFLSRHQSAETQCWRCRYICVYMCMYVVRTICNVRARVVEAENSITLTTHTSTKVFIALRWCSETIMVLLINILTTVTRTVNP